MINIATCGHIALQDEGSLMDALASCARARGLDVPVVSFFANPTDLIDTCMPPADDRPPFDIVICALDLQGINGVDVLDELRGAGLIDDGLQVVLCVNNALSASHAVSHLASGCLLEPIAPNHFDRVMGNALLRATRLHKSSVVLRCRDGLRRIAFSHITYIETSGRDQLIHRQGKRSSLLVRMSSRAMFAALEHDPRFFKAGSSYVLNLDHLDSLSLRSSYVLLLDGSRISVPLRLRTSLASAMCTHAAAFV